MVRSVKRIPLEHRWGEDCVKWVNRVLWNRYTGDEYADGDLPEEVTAPAANPEGIRTGVIIVETREKAPREFYI